MARTFLLSIVCLSFFAGNAQTAMPPFAPVETDIQVNFISHFSQPIGLRTWEIYADTTDAWKRWELAEGYTFGKGRGSIPMIVDLQSLHPYFRDKVINLIHACRAKGIELAIVETYRTHAKQNEYKSMGRKYTRLKGGQSRHQYGMAVDVVPVIDSIPQWHNIALWRKVGVVGERLGLRWGGRWRRLFDPGHFECLAINVTSSPQYPCLAEDLKALQRHWRAWEIEQSAVARKEPAPTTIKYPSSKQGGPGGR